MLKMSPYDPLVELMEGLKTTSFLAIDNAWTEDNHHELVRVMTKAINVIKKQETLAQASKQRGVANQTA
jgi:hypothetical protein